MDPGVLTIIAVICAHWVCAISMVFVNKQLVSQQDFVQDVSVFIVWIQNVLGCFIFMVIKTVIDKCRHQGIQFQTPKFELESLVDPDMIMSSVSFTGTLVFNNLMLKYITVAFYQVARSLTLIFVVAFSVCILNETITRKVALSCVYIIFGFYLAVDEELASQGIQTAGIVYGVLASLSAALSGVFFKRFQRKRVTTSMQLTFNNCILSALILFPLLFSSGQLSNFTSSPAASSMKTWTLLILSGVVSLSMGWISALQIALTSPLTHNISINAKGLFQTLVAVFISGDLRPWKWWMGNCFVFLGIATYTALKLNSGKGSNQQSLQTDEVISKKVNRV